MMTMIRTNLIFSLICTSILQGCGSVPIWSEGNTTLATLTRIQTKVGDAEISRIPGGYFQMGHPGRDKHFKVTAPRHTAFVSPFWVSRHLVTVEKFVQFLNETGMPPEQAFFNFNPAPMNVEIAGGKASVPPENAGQGIGNVTWEAAHAYCEWLSDDRYRFRLPTEAEWEFMASNGGTTRYPWGNSSKIKGFTWEPIRYKGQYVMDLPVGTLTANANRWGVYDLIGSSDQWCSDFYSEQAYTQGDRINPKGPSPQDAYTSYMGIPARVVRGGASGAPGGFMTSVMSASYSRKFYYVKPHPNVTGGPFGFRWIVEFQTSP